MSKFVKHKQAKLSAFYPSSKAGISTRFNDLTKISDFAQSTNSHSGSLKRKHNDRIAPSAPTPVAESKKSNEKYTKSNNCSKKKKTNSHIQ